jgi:hypothetical protein
MVRFGDGVKDEQVSRRRLVLVDPRDVREQGVDRDRGVRAPDLTANVVPPIIVIRRLPTKNGELRPRGASKIPVRKERTELSSAGAVIASRPASARLSWPDVKPVGTMTTKAVK